MTLQITGKNVDAGDTYQTYVSDKIRTVLKKYLGREYDGHVRLEKVRGLFKTNCSVRLASGLLLEAQGEGGDAYASADSAVERLETRVRRYKSRLKSHSAAASPTGRRKGDLDGRDYVVGVAEDDDHQEAPAAAPLIIAETPHAIVELSVSDAVMRFDVTEAPFMVFRNAAHGGINVVYRRADGHVGWIDAEPLSQSGVNGASQPKAG
ncbi:MAG: ribosome-associated translation inhibitor RaiA [Hyphomicrobium sp.]|jgi:ribosomal subunit interface protein|nr:ribosome-associated translation inhibitor RaiA [Hyphomicrobium sp.]